MTLDEVEAQETIYDPLGGAPNIPFGHLNPAWLEFRENLTPEDQIWSFSSVRDTDWGDQESKKGYVIVKSSATGHYFITSHKFIKNQS